MDMRLLKTLVPAACLAATLPSAVFAGSLDRSLPLLASIMGPRHAPVMEADFTLMPRPEISRLPNRRPRLVRQMGCIVSGTPVEFPNDIRLTANHFIAAGSQAEWYIPNTNWMGVVFLPDMVPGQSLHVSNALPGGWPAGVICHAQVD